MIGDNMDKYKLICLDVDGTLYDSHKRIPKEIIEAIREAAAKGIKIAITTGRMYNYGNLYGSKLGVDTLTVASNGAFVKYGEEILIHETIDDGDLLYLTELLGRLGLFTHYNEWNALICDRPVGDGNGYIDANLHLPPERRIEIIETDDLLRTFRERDSRIVKSISLEREHPEKLLKLRRALEGHPTLEAVSSTWFGLEVIKAGVSKAKGIDALIGRLGITKDEVIAIGDGENDLSMIGYAGMGVAMGNAIPELKAIAKMITDTNDNAGVAKAIRELCL
jgi:hypothetical protein